MNNVIWLTGLSGSGKTTLAQALYRLISRTKNAIIVDGDQLRAMTDNYNFDKDGRFANVQKAIDICKENEDKTVIVALISPLREMRDYAQQELGDRFVEVYVQCSIKECIHRDVKGLYNRAISGELKNFTGIDQLYEEPVLPHLVVNTEYQSVTACIAQIVKYV